MSESLENARLLLDKLVNEDLSNDLQMDYRHALLNVLEENDYTNLHELSKQRKYEEAFNQIEEEMIA